MSNDENPKKWTIIIIAQIDDDVKWEYTELEEAIISYYRKDGNLRYKIFEFNQRDGSFVIREPKMNGSVPALEEISSGTDFYKKETLINFFSDVLTDHESDRLMLITWGHGSGFSFFHHGDPENELQNGPNFSGTKTGNYIIHGLDKNIPGSKKKKYSLRNILFSQHIANLSVDKATLKNFRFDQKVVERIRKNELDELYSRLENLYTAEDLAYIFNAAFGRKKVDVFIANNCWMNTFETGSALKDQVTVYAAPQTIVPFAGINYDKLFRAVKMHPDIKPLELAYNITDNYALKYTDGNSFAKNFKKNRSYIDIRELSLSVNYLPKYNEIIKCLKRLCRHLVDKLDKKNPVLRNSYLKRIDIARSFCGDFTHQANYIDFTNFFCELIKGFQGDDPGELKDIYYDFFYAKNQALLSILNPGKLFSFMPEYFYSQSPQMFSIYFPPRSGRTKLQNKFIQHAYFKTKFKNVFKDDKLIDKDLIAKEPMDMRKGWIEFLSTYLDIEILN